MPGCCSDDDDDGDDDDKDGAGDESGKRLVNDQQLDSITLDYLSLLACKFSLRIISAILNPKTRNSNSRDSRSRITHTTKSDE